MTPLGYFLTLLTILLIGLKLTSHIDWHWAWVLAPLGGPLVFAAACFTFAWLCRLCLRLFETPQERYAREIKARFKALARQLDQH
jgi:hypothetical protein